MQLRVQFPHFLHSMARRFLSLLVVLLADSYGLQLNWTHHFCIQNRKKSLVIINEMQV
jgi:hypothetical protein